ncbi:MAG: polysaccharide biosynthesis protein [Alphaproteobacteria bacterium]|nr:polysaccharide biosynthesis protein [Alphaproteobacteria bacterium]
MRKRNLLIFGHDLLVAAVALLLSLALRLGVDVVDYDLSRFAYWTLIFLPICAAVFWALGTHKVVWRYTSLSDVITLAQAVALTNLLFLLAIFLLNRLDLFPRSTPLINAFVMTALLIGPRIMYRTMKDWHVQKKGTRSEEQLEPVLLVGAGNEADVFLREISRLKYPTYRAVGIVDMHESRVGRSIRGVRVMGIIDALPDVIARLTEKGDRPKLIILTGRSTHPAIVQKLLEFSGELGIEIAHLPKITEVKGEVSAKVAVRPIDVESLLGRPRSNLDRRAVAQLICGRRILVTGAGGTIGSELCRKICELGPAHITLLDSSEYQLYRIDLELFEEYPQVSRRVALGDVRSRPTLLRLFEEEQPQIVFHAAAMKHVPMVEANPNEAITINVTGTKNVADISREMGVDTMICISTDKAINPTSVMGATKRLAEQYCQSLDVLPPERSQTRFITVRFGNVLGSTGSVVQLFQRQLMRGGPLTVTDPAMKRYFLTVGEAIDLVLHACTLKDRSLQHTGAIVVLDMGEPIKILDLAQQMIRLAGLRPDQDIRIVFTGPRPGEKLHEELFYANEQLDNTTFEGIMVAHPHTADHQVLARALNELDEHARAHNTERSLDLICRLVPGYRVGGQQEASPSPERVSGDD